MARKGKRGGVKIPVGLDKKPAQKDAKNLAKDLRSSIRPVVDVVHALRLGFDVLRATIGKTIAAFRKLVDLAGVQERAERRIVAAISLRQKFGKADLELLLKSNAARQQLTGIGDELQLQLQAQAALLGVEASQLGRVTEATIGLQSVIGGALQSSLNIVLKAYGGNILALRRYGIEVNSAGAALDFLTEKFQLSRSDAETFAGRIDILKANFSDMIEEIGRGIVRNPEVKTFLATLNEDIRTLTASIKEDAPKVREFFSNLVKELQALGKWLKENRGELELLAKVTGGAFAISKVAKAAGLIKGGAVAVGTVTGKLAATPAAVAAKGLAASALSAAGTAFGALGAGITGIAAGGAVALTGGTLLLLPSADAQSLKQGILEGITGRRQGTGITRGTPRFRATRIFGAGRGSPEEGGRIGGFTEFADFEGTIVESDEAKVIERAQKKREAAIKRHLTELKRLADALEAERRATQAAFSAARRAGTPVLEFGIGPAPAGGLGPGPIGVGGAVPFGPGRAKAEAQAQTAAADASNKATLAEFKQNILLGRNSLKELLDETRDTTLQFKADMAVLGATAMGGFIQNMVASLVTGRGTLKQAILGTLGMLLSTVGDTMIALGTASLAAALATTPIPLLWPIFGGPIGVTGSLGLIAAGSVLKGVGGGVSALGRTGGGARASAGGGRTGAPPTPTLGSNEFSRNIGGDARAAVQVHLNVIGTRGLPVGNDLEVARWLAQLLETREAITVV